MPIGIYQRHSHQGFQKGQKINYKHYSHQGFQKGHKTNLGRKHPKEFGRKISEREKGERFTIICHTCRNKFFVIFCRKNIARFCSRRCSGISNGFQKGHKGYKSRLEVKLSKETRRKMSQSARKGKNSNFYKHGKSSENYLLRNSSKYKLWHESVFEYDNYTCWICQIRGYKLHAHHLQSFSKYPKLRFKKSNGITLCNFCHRVYTNFGFS